MVQMSRWGFEPARFGFTDHPKCEIDALPFWPSHLVGKEGIHILILARVVIIFADTCTVPQNNISISKRICFHMRATIYNIVLDATGLTQTLHGLKTYVTALWEKRATTALRCCEGGNPNIHFSASLFWQSDHYFDGIIQWESMDIWMYVYLFIVYFVNRWHCYWCQYWNWWQRDNTVIFNMRIGVHVFMGICEYMHRYIYTHIYI